MGRPLSQTYLAEDSHPIFHVSGIRSFSRHAKTVPDLRSAASSEMSEKADRKSTVVKTVLLNLTFHDV